MTKLFKRTNKSVIGAEPLKFLYDEVVVYCENEITDYRGYNQNKNPFLNNLECTMGFSLVGDIKKVKNGDTDVFYFSCNGGKIECWFHHLRNAIAHNRIFLSPNGGIILQDEYNGSLTMHAEVSSFDKIKNIILEIKKNWKV